MSWSPAKNPKSAAAKQESVALRSRCTILGGRRQLRPREMIINYRCVHVGPVVQQQRPADIVADYLRFVNLSVKKVDIRILMA